MRILLVADARPDIETVLRERRLLVSATCPGEDAVELARLYGHDLIMTVTPAAQGRALLREIRHAGVQAPILMLIDENDAEERLACLDIGADECLSQPIGKEELVARLHAVVRRSRGLCHSMIVAGSLAVDIADGTATADGKDLGLTPQEYEAVECLALRKGAYVTKEMLVDLLYGDRDEPMSNIIHQLIWRIRRKLEDVIGTSCSIETLSGRGYVLRDARPAYRRLPHVVPILAGEIDRGLRPGQLTGVAEKAAA